MFNTRHSNSELFPAFFGPQGRLGGKSWSFQSLDRHAPTPGGEDLVTAGWRDCGVPCSGPGDCGARPPD